MKYLSLIAVITLIISCSNPAQEKSESLKIESVLVKPIIFKNICFQVDSSYYPKITGLSDQTFEKQLNDILISNFNNYVDSAKAGSECRDEDELKEEYKDMNEKDKNWWIKVRSSYPSVNSWYEDLSNSNDIVSFIQYFQMQLNGYGGFGGGSWWCDATITNLDIKNRTILNQSDLNMNYDKREIINKGLKSYIDKNIETAIPGSYPFINSKTEFDKLKFALRNDSVMLIMDFNNFYAAQHYPHIIPIDKWVKK